MKDVKFMVDYFHILRMFTFLVSILLTVNLNF